MSPMDRTGCPACGAPLSAPRPPLPIRGRCGRCGALLALSRRPFHAPLRPSAGDELERAAEAVADDFSKQGAPAEVDAATIKRFHTRPYVRLVRSAWSDDERDMTVVMTRSWTVELARRLARDLLRVDQEDAAAGRVTRYRFATSHAPPAALRYTFADDPRARFERTALCRVEFTSPEEIIPLAKVPVLIELAFELARDHLGLSLPLESLSEIERMENTIHRLMRLGVHKERPLPRGRHVPHTSLLLLGLVYGELLGIGLKTPRRWTNDARAPYGLVLDIRPAPSASAHRFNPLGRVTKLYLKGSAESLVSFTWSVLDQIRTAAGSKP
jgi:hypothetical protein